MASPLSVSLAFGQIILVRYVESSLFLLGLIGSLLNILLFSQRNLQFSSCCTYFLASSLAAIVLLLMGIIPQLYALNHTPDSIFNSNFCKTRGYISQMSAMLCRWLLTIASIDRCLLISANARIRLFSTVHTARKVVFLLCIIWLVFPIHMLIFTETRIPGYITCILSTNTSAVYHGIYTITLGGLFPPLIMIVCTKVLWNSLQLKRQRRRIINTNSRERRLERRDSQVLVMLLIQIVIFILFTLPYMSFNLYSALTRSVTNKSTDRLAIESFLQLFTEITVFIYPAMTFYSNTLSSQTFRNEFIDLFKRMIRHERQFSNRTRIDPVITITKRHDLPMVIIT